jgi:hypothetical protein
MFRTFLLASLVSLTPSSPEVLDVRSSGPALAAAGTIVQSGFVFTGVFEGNRSFDLPVTLDGFAPKQGKLQSVEIELDVRMSGEYTIQPTPVPPNGTVESHSTTALELGGKSLASASIDFAPIPWIYPVNFPLNVLWALDENASGSFSDKQTLRAFTGNKPVRLTAAIDVTAKVVPAGWASPHLQGVIATWPVRYHFD